MRSRRAFRSCARRSGTMRDSRATSKRGTAMATGSSLALAPDTAARSLAAIAVLPFTDMSPERDQSYFCEGVAEELIDALNGVAGLRVACRSCSFKFRDAGVDVREVGGNWRSRRWCRAACARQAISCASWFNSSTQPAAIADGRDASSTRLGDVFGDSG